jgi:hypothetical protein
MCNTLMDEISVGKLLPTANLRYACRPSIATTKGTRLVANAGISWLNYNSNKLQCLNKVRMHQQVLYLSDVMDTSGRGIDRKYLQPRPMEEKWSDLVFSIDQPAPLDFRIWKDAIPQNMVRHYSTDLGTWR